MTASTISDAGASPTASSAWLSLSEAVSAGYGGYSTLRRHIADGRLPSAVKAGRAWRVSRLDLEALTVASRPQPYESIEAAVKRIVDAAPPLTAAQRQQLAAILSGGAR